MALEIVVQAHLAVDLAIDLLGCSISPTSDRSNISRPGLYRSLQRAGYLTIDLLGHHGKTKW
jgi:hypothetical protein